MGILEKIKLLKYRNNPYFNLFFKPVEKKPLEEIEFTCFDLETTGLDVKKDEIISIGGIKIKNLKLDFSQTFYQVVKPEKPPEKESILVHGITPSQLERAPDIKDILPDFMDFIKGTVLVGFFVQFDIKMVSKYTTRYYGFPLLNPYIDLIDIYQEKFTTSYTPYEKRKAKSLEELASQYSIPVEKRHDAFYDSLITGLVFIAMAKKERSIVERVLSKRI